jgi:hypothetical protein
MILFRALPTTLILSSSLKRIANGNTSKRAKALKANEDSNLVWDSSKDFV